MSERVKIEIPRYQQIAVDVASKIAEKHYKVGEKIYARSALASQYGVSPETARRAICVLTDMGIVETTKGSGVVITSREKALGFVKQYTDLKTVSELKKNIIRNVDNQIKDILQLKDQMIDLIEKTDKFKSTNPFIPYEIVITVDSKQLGKNLSEINFWHNTTATIIAIRRNNVLMMSPGPYAELREHDVLYFVGDECCPQRVNSFLYE